MGTEKEISKPDIDITTNESNVTVVEWLQQSQLEDLVPIFTREQLLDWGYVKKLTIPLLQSINVPLGLCFKFGEAVKCRFPDQEFDIVSKDFEATARALYEWIRQERKEKMKRPPWLGAMEYPRQSTSVDKRKPALDTNLKRSDLLIRKVKLGPISNLTKVISFPQSKISRSHVSQGDFALAADSKPDSAPKLHERTNTEEHRKPHPKISICMKLTSRSIQENQTPSVSKC